MSSLISAALGRSSNAKPSLAALVAGTRKGGRNLPSAWWHGTSAEALDAILRQGLRGRAQQGRAMLAPIRGRVYLAKEPGQALVYALGGAVLGVDLTKIPAVVRQRFAGRGALLQVEVTSDAELLPDEDWVGEVVSTLLDDNPSRELRIDDPRMTAWARRVLVTLPDRTERSLRKLPSWRLDEVAYWAKIGKQVIVALRRSADGRALLAQGARLAPAASTDGQVRVVAAWTFDRIRDCAALGKDGVHAFEVMERVSVPGRPA